MDAFVKLPEVMQVIGHGPTKSSVVAGHARPRRRRSCSTPTCGWSTDEQFPFALHYFTGSKEHNIRLRQRAIDRGLALNEYAPGRRQEGDPVQDEADIFAALGLDYIAAGAARGHRRDRGGRGAHAARRWSTAADIRGVFHNHTTSSDGSATLEEMALAAKKLGLRVLRRRRPLAVADHRQRPAAERVRKQWAEIDALNKKLKGFRIFKGTEVRHPRGRLARLRRRAAGGVRLRRRQRPHALRPCREEEMTARVVQGAVRTRR